MLLQPEQEKPSDELVAIPDGQAGIAATLAQMVRLTKEYRTNPVIRRLAESIVTAVPSKNWYTEAAAIQEWVRNNIRYTQDVYDVETLKTPLTLLMDRYGDCDDMSMLAGTLLQTIGHPVRYVAVGTQEPGQFDHVYVETRIGSRWVALETTEQVGLGWTPPQITARMIRNV